MIRYYSRKEKKVSKIWLSSIRDTLKSTKILFWIMRPHTTYMYHHLSKEERKPPDKETVGSFLRVVPRLQICYCDEPFDSWNHHSSSRILIYFEKWRNRRERRLNEHIGLIKVEKLCVCAQSAVFQDGVDGRTTNKI